MNRSALFRFVDLSVPTLLLAFITVGLSFGFVVFDDLPEVHKVCERGANLGPVEIQDSQTVLFMIQGHLEKCLCEIKVALLLYSGLMIFGLRSSLSV